MARRAEPREFGRPLQTVPSRVGLVVHPTRAIEEPLRQLRRWSKQHGVGLLQIRGFSQQQHVADEGDAADCDLLISIGGDGTALAAIRAGVTGARPVLAVACGSLGVLTSVAADGLIDAIERFGRGDWIAWSLPALNVSRESGSQLFALNDIAIVRAGEGQLRLIAEVDGHVFARIAGDGCIVSTPVGSSAYALAAGGPLIAPELHAFAVTPLPTHGGSCPPLVIGADSIIRLTATPGHGGARLELDGQVVDTLVGALTISFRTGVATVVSFADQEPFLTVLRKRKIIADSPRILAEEARS